MSFAAEPLEVPSLTEACIAKLEEMILSGQLQSGEKLPAERKLAEILNISRPVVHDALVDLAGKGLVEIVPRSGVYVADFRTHGSCALLTSLLTYHEGALSPELFDSLAEMRLLMETETARLAAGRRSVEQLRALEQHVESERSNNGHSPADLAEQDFTFHQLVALASGNTMYLLIINSFKPVYTNLTRRFFAHYAQGQVIEQVIEYHRQLVAAIAEQNEEAAAGTMAGMLVHGEQHLKEIA